MCRRTFEPEADRRGAAPSATGDAADALERLHALGVHVGEPDAELAALVASAATRRPRRTRARSGPSPPSKRQVSGCPCSGRYAVRRCIPSSETFTACASNEGPSAPPTSTSRRTASASLRARGDPRCSSLPPSSLRDRESGQGGPSFEPHASRPRHRDHPRSRAAARRRERARPAAAAQPDRDPGLHAARGLRAEAARRRRARTAPRARCSPTSLSGSTRSGRPS